MADKTTNKTKRTQTVRERTQEADKPSRKRRVRQTASAATKPLGTAGKGVKKAAKPFAFLLAPFKTKPMRKLGHILAAVLLINYFRSSWQELRQVTWPNRKETAKLTIAVFLFAVVFGIAVAIVDFGLDKIFEKILLS